jgi:hypothetical protein
MLLKSIFSIEIFVVICDACYRNLDQNVKVSDLNPVAFGNQGMKGGEK